jgi:hypothetical protein
LGEAKQKRSATQKFISQYPRCALCGGDRESTTREHMPPKSLFDNSHRPDRLVMPACHQCNNGTSKADLTAAMISRWNYNSPEQEREDHSRLVRQVKIQAPELLDEWTAINANPSDRKGAIDHLRSYGVAVPDDAGVASIGKQTIKQLNIFAHKAALCLYFEQARTPLPNAGLVSAHWRSKEDFSKEGVPALFAEIFPDVAALVQGQWDTSETFQYRYALNNENGLFGCLARLRTGLYTAGFAVRDTAGLQDALEGEWIRPNQLLDEHEHFYKKV